MITYARFENGKPVEVIRPAKYPDGARAVIDGALQDVSGQFIPLAERFHADIVAQLQPVADDYELPAEIAVPFEDGE